MFTGRCRGVDTVWHPASVKRYVGSATGLRRDPRGEMFPDWLGMSAPRCVLLAQRQALPKRTWLLSWGSGTRTFQGWSGADIW